MGHGAGSRGEQGHCQMKGMLYSFQVARGVFEADSFPTI